MSNCIVCGSKETFQGITPMKGYIPNLEYDIFICTDCKSSFVPENTLIDGGIYDKVYEIAGDVGGYDRYYKYAISIKQQNDPLYYLSTVDYIYSPVYQFVQNKSDLSILEVGCGYGYLTYALNHSGHSCTGVDVSSQAIGYAIDHYGQHYQVCEDSELFTTFCNTKFDLIIATEVIEHVRNPYQFITTLNMLLNDGGSIIITTPNKSAVDDKTIWKGDQPPVHISYITSLGLATIGDNLNLKYSYFNFIPYAQSSNLLFKYILTKFTSRIYGSFPMTYERDITIFNSVKTKISIKSYIIKFFESYFVRTISNYLFRFIMVFSKNKHDSFDTVGIIFTSSLIN